MDKIGYCVKCKLKSKIVNEKVVKTTNGKRALSGECVKCGTKMMRFLKNTK